MAIVGLAFGAGFYEGAVYATIGVFLAEGLFTKIGYRVLKHSPEISLYMEYTERKCLKPVLQLYQNKGIKVLDMEVARASDNGLRNFYAMFILRINKNCTACQLAELMREIEGVNLVEKL